MWQAGLMILVVHCNIPLRYFTSASVILPALPSWQHDFQWTDEESVSQTVGWLEVNGRAGMGPWARLTPNSLPMQPWLPGLMWGSISKIQEDSLYSLLGYPEASFFVSASP